MTRNSHSFLKNKKQATFEDDFELLCFRHNYFTKSKNPTQERLMAFSGTVRNISKRIFSKNKEVFFSVGIEVEDLYNLGLIHTVSFLSMGGLYENPDKMENFIKRNKKAYGEDSLPSEREIFLKECYDLSRFLKQRIQEIALFCKRKNRNIRGTGDVEYFFLGQEGCVDVPHQKIISSPEKFGYKKITRAKYLDAVKENTPNNKRDFITKDGLRIRAVHLKGSFLVSEDLYTQYFDPSTHAYNCDPEDLLIQREFLNKI